MVSALDYTWASKTNSQSVAVPLTFENIIFTTTPEINGWIYNPITGGFTCLNTGKYLVSFTVNMGSTGGATLGSVFGAINTLEIIGSDITQNFQSTSINQPWTNFFIMTVTAGDVFSLQFTGTAVSVTISTAVAIAGSTPSSASMTITRIL